MDEGVAFDASHPMHLHGHSFRVVALEKLGQSTSVQEVIELDRAGTAIHLFESVLKTGSLASA